MDSIGKNYSVWKGSYNRISDWGPIGITAPFFSDILSGKLEVQEADESDLTRTISIRKWSEKLNYFLSEQLSSYHDSA